MHDTLLALALHSHFQLPPPPPTPFQQHFFTGSASAIPLQSFHVHLIGTILRIVFGRLREKEKLFAVFRDIERQMKDSNFELDRDLYPDNIERSWSQLMMLFQVIITISEISVKRR